MSPRRGPILNDPAHRPVPLDRLADAIRAVEWGGKARAGGWEGPEGLSTGWATGPGAGGEQSGGAWDGFIGRLARGCVHEWCGGVHAAAGASSTAIGSWFPPLTLMVHLAWRALDAAGGGSESDGSGGHAKAGANAVAGGRTGRGGQGRVGCVVWIGRRCWPYAHALVRRRGRAPPDAGLDRRLLAASLFVDPPDDAARLWAIDLALRAGGDEAGEEGGVALVIADGSRLDMAGSRRLQLAAEAGARAAEARGTPRFGGLGLILRPPWESKQLSAAATRWMVRPIVNPGEGGPGVCVRPPRWSVELLRCKGVQPPPDGRREWMLELDRAGRVIRVLPSLADRPAAETRAAG